MKRRKFVALPRDGLEITKMRSQKLFAAAALLAASSLAPVSADMMSSYQNYQRALQQGDIESAIQYAEEAWRAAKSEQGESETTAVLAYNYARMIYATTPERAIEPIRSVIAIAGEEAPQFADDPPMIMLRLSEALANPDDRSAFEALKELMSARSEATETAPTGGLVGARAWRLIALTELERANYRQAAEAARRAEDNFVAAGGAEDELRDVLMIGGVAFMASSRSEWADRAEAFRRFNRVIALSAPQQGIESFDPVLASALAWRLAAQSANESSLDARLQTGSLLSRDGPGDSGPAYFRWAFSRPAGESCEPEWTASPEPRFPAAGRNRADQGAAIIGFHLDENGEVIDARILAEVPTRAGYGPNLLKAVKKWRAAPLVEGCRENHIVSYRFTVT